ncbi:hypothetical protein L873DRAFT_1928874 [Choiromyces venosus 120613-1]|uniref:Uncharacterized protein n=1 Tax=Choiromyces venosus 120613-1 TaxID=1336337 RepID=A0A3N4K330_9PEZI|nr:hypothetical protein L873DRAFT_1928874 [Choiromyces venosus 120613-1]
MMIGYKLYGHMNLPSPWLVLVIAHRSYIDLRKSFILIVLIKLGSLEERILWYGVGSVVR